MPNIVFPTPGRRYILLRFSDIRPTIQVKNTGAHTRTQADVWSIEGAVESGRSAAQAIDPTVKVLPQYKPVFFKMASSIDDAFYRVGLPHILEVIIFGILAGLAMYILKIKFTK